MTADDLDLLDEKPSARSNYAAILKRRRWYILAPLLLCGFLGSIVSQVWPLLYKSQALILVEQQKVPEQYVTPNVIISLQNRLDGMTQQILSRTRLQQLIDQFGLYARERAGLTMDELVDKMREHVNVQLVQTLGQQGGVSGFRITYSGQSARTAQRVTNELTSLFIDEGLRQRTQQSTNTTQFLEGQLNNSQAELAVQEQRLREYKMQFLGELPQQEQGNLQILSSLEAQLYATEAAMQRAEQQKTYLEAMNYQYRALNEIKLAADGTVVADGTPPKSPAVVHAETTLLDLEKQLVELRSVYADGYPKVLQLEAQVAAIRKRKAELEAEDAVRFSAFPKNGTDVTGERPTAARLSLAEIDSRLKASEVEIANQAKDVAELHKQIETVRDRVKMTPVREQQLAEITRTYENSRAQYQSLLQKKLQSELASNLEKRQGGEQFRVLDPASLPEKPEGRLRILGLGWLAGLCIGIAIAALREFTGGCVNDDRDVKLATSLPIFRIPVIRTPREEYRRRVQFVAEIAAVILLAIVAIGASARTYLMG